MNTPLWVNPFDNSIVPEILARVLVLYLVAILVLLIINKGDLKKLYQSNVGQRIIGWMILTPLYFIGVFCGLIPGLVVVTLFMAGVISEYSKISKLHDSYAYVMGGLVSLSLIIATFFTEYFYSLPLIYFLFISALAIRINDKQQSFRQASVALYGSIWLIFSLSHIVLLSKFNNEFDDTRALLFLVIFAVALADIGGYVFGKFFHKINLFDKSKVAVNLSPNKTYIGTLGYIFGALMAVWISWFAIEQYMGVSLWILAAIIIGVFSFVGGLTHSYFKRYYGIKDSGRIIPGHGGVIDRIDSITRVVVILYYFLIIFV